MTGKPPIMKLTRIFFPLRLAIAMALVIVPMLRADSVFNIKDYGAKDDGNTINTKAIQAAIDACAAAGGGRVLIPNGRFVSGTLRLKSNVAIYLDASAVLQGSPVFEDYEWVPYSRGKRRALIYAIGVDNIAILGRGMIDGNGAHENFRHEDPYNGIPGGVRPFSVYIDNSTRVQLRDIKMINSAFWNIKFEICDDVLVDGLSIHNKVIANNDGINVMDCSNVRISNCKIYSNDDAICLKSNNKDVGVKNVTITNCIISSESSAIKFGVASCGGFENITVSNCAIYDTRLSGIGLKIVEGGTMDRVTIANITMHNTNGSIFMKLARKKGFSAGVFRNVIISNIIADGIGCWKADKSRKYYKDEYDQRIGIVIAGSADCTMENVTLSNIHLQFAGSASSGDAARPLKDNVPRGYPKYNNFGITPAYGINCQYVKNIRFNNIVLDCIENDGRPAIFFQESENVTLNGISAEVSDTARSYVRMKNQKGAFIINSKPTSGKVPFVSIEESAKNITIMGNDFGSIKGALIKDSAVLEKEIHMQGNL